MDPVDFALLRGMMRAHAFDFVGIDPRRTVAELGEYAGISRNAAADRLSAWRSSGFLSSYSVYPNPDLFGLSLVGRFFQASDAQALARCRDRFVESTGFFLLYQTGAMTAGPALVGAVWLTGDPRWSGHGADVLEPPQGVTVLSPTFPVLFPASRVRMRPSDWRLVRAWRRDPDARPPDFAKEVGLSPRQVLRRMNTLLDGDGVFVLPHFDFTKARGSVVLVSILSPDGPETDAVRSAIANEYRDRLPVMPTSRTDLMFPSPGATPARSTLFMLPVPTGQSAMTLAESIRDWDGVRDVIVSVPMRDDENRPTFDELLRRVEERPADDAARPSAPVLRPPLNRGDH